jgi:hypothetical protein
MKPGTTDHEEATCLLDEYQVLVKSALHWTLPAPAPHLVRAAVAASSALAVKLDRDHCIAVWGELKGLSQFL